jgi:hypothetical protein
LHRIDHASIVPGALDGAAIMVRPGSSPTLSMATSSTGSLLPPPL